MNFWVHNSQKTKSREVKHLHPPLKNEGALPLLLRLFDRYKVFEIEDVHIDELG